MLDSSVDEVLDWVKMPGYFYNSFQDKLIDDTFGWQAKSSDTFLKLGAQNDVCGQVWSNSFRDDVFKS